MRNSCALLLMTALAVTGNPPYRLALPGYRYEFPRDHFNHPDFQTEWWYYTGNLRDGKGRPFGFELTFFRRAVDRNGGSLASLWEVEDVWLAHFALSDLMGGKFFHTERLNRTGPGLAGADVRLARVWNGNWRVQWTQGQQEQSLQAIAEGFAVDLKLRPQKPPVIHGKAGVSQKAQGEGRASHYVSFTRLATAGVVTIAGEAYRVEGLAWMDHEFFTHQLEGDQVGWDWFSLQLQDGSELMLFRLRRKDGSADPFSAGTYIKAGGESRSLSSTEFQLRPGREWTSNDTKGRYPIEWTVTVPVLGIQLSTRTSLPEQELTSRRGGITAYWEGAISADGTKAGAPLTGSGYLEMTGYAAPVKLGE